MFPRGSLSVILMLVLLVTTKPVQSGADDEPTENERRRPWRPVAAEPREDPVTSHPSHPVADGIGDDHARRCHRDGPRRIEMALDRQPADRQQQQLAGNR